MIQDAVPHREQLPLTGEDLRAGFKELGLPASAVVIVHASLSAFGHIDGGPATLLGALRDHLGPYGTVVVPAFTGDAVRDPHPGAGPDAGAHVDADRAAVPLFHDKQPTLMGALPTALLADPDRLRSTHPQASVAAVGARAREITERQPFAYAVGRHSPFDRMHDLGAHILLLGVGHNRNSFLHYAESLIPNHRRKLRRFPYVIDGQRVWVEVPDVGDDNGRHFPGVGAEAEQEGLVRIGRIGGAECRLMASGPFIEFARRRLQERLAEEGRHSATAAQPPARS
ncbi:aminoglycoside 3-N-acetyltransferase [Streptomyces sp. TLI_55]|uniref:aminoglycoside N(3)-acetyltransferase n=1 Tax=Streptomyces sp. TLI_55 TaxID=1938861 RepID=UPI000BD8820C|nr:AAC(3) family N-acetyltransferase [Streptomyces sp. TLI_55]SNX88537.1 aminoglycoside 3-N-acetyltransferase [Streptomyces sp. TLI_55]